MLILNEVYFIFQRTKIFIVVKKCNIRTTLIYQYRNYLIIINIINRYVKDSSLNYNFLNLLNSFENIKILN